MNNFVRFVYSSIFTTIVFSALVFMAVAPAPQQPAAGTVFTIDASAPAPAPETDYLQMGSERAGVSPAGHRISVNSRSIMLDEKPWLPVMGEFHYSRCPEQYWEEELLKMKAGGVQIVSTYIIWIHHEEVKGHFVWTGRKNLRRFAGLCAKHGMYLYPRIGPWAHAEVRNGGFPDWLLEECRTRVNDSTYFSYTRNFYREIAKQLKGMLWKDGGPVIGIQIENEYTNRSAEGGESHIVKLKTMAVDAGFDVPLYTITGWDNAVIPPHIAVPVYGGYPDEPWNGSRNELPPDPQRVYQFRAVPLLHYPMCTAELGSGNEPTYHRRVRIEPEDMPPIAITALGSGVNLVGYYMYHGGSNPDGTLSTLQESQLTGYPNDVTIVSYDFQAPLGEYGQMQPSFRPLKVIHRFIHDFGSMLAPMRAVLPDIVPTGQHDTSTIRISARTAGDSGFVFVNNYLRNYPLPDQKGIRIKVKLPSGTVTIPQEPVDIPSQTSFFWPLNIGLSGPRLIYGTAQPFTMMNDGKAIDYFFVATPGIRSEFVLLGSTVTGVHSEGGRITRIDSSLRIDNLTPSTSPAFELTAQSGRRIRVFLFSPQMAGDSWIVPIRGRDCMLMTEADVVADGSTISMRSRNQNAFSFAVFPTVEFDAPSTASLKKAGTDGMFTRYTSQATGKKIPVRYALVRRPQSVPPVKMGPFFDWRNCSVAMAPPDSLFDKSGLWQIDVPKNASARVGDGYLDIDYEGDIGRLYSGKKLIADNFFIGSTWEIDLKRLRLEGKHVTLEILPLRSDAPIYLPKSCALNYDGSNQVATVKSINIVPEYQVRLKISRLLVK